MRILLVRPNTPKQSINLQSFMICEPLELEYVARALIDDYIYFAANNGIILRCSPDDLSVLEVWFLPDELAGLIQGVKIENLPIAWADPRQYNRMRIILTGEGTMALFDIKLFSTVLQTQTDIRVINIGGQLNGKLALGFLAR